MFKRFLTVALAALFALLAGTATALASSAPVAVPYPQHESVTQTQSFSPLFTCPDRSICLFPNNDFTGNYGSSPVIVVPAGTTSGTWFSFDSIGAGSPHPGSINNNSGSSIWVYDRQAPVVSGSNPACLTQGKYTLSHSYGYFELFYSDSTCAHSSTRPLP